MYGKDGLMGEQKGAPGSHLRTARPPHPGAPSWGRRPRPWQVSLGLEGGVSTWLSLPHDFGLRQ